MGLLIKNGEIVTATDRYVADIYCQDETISAIGRDLDAAPGDRVIDASGKLVIPGAIDPHVHMALPFMGTVSKDDFTTGSIAALAGGTTCFIDFCIPGQNESPLAALETWHAKSDGKAAHDYTWHLAVTRFDERTEPEIREIVGMGMTSFKVFLAYRGAFELVDDELFKTLKLAKELGVITTVHAENAAMVEAGQRELLAAGKTRPFWHGRSRLAFVEGEGVRHITNMARYHDAPLYIVHTSCEPALRAANDARFRGQTVFVETCPSYLFLDESYTDTEDFSGAKYVLSPPLRPKEHQEPLWAGLKMGHIDVVGTDHCSFDYADQKHMGKDSFTLIPNGLPLIEDRLTLLWSYGVGEGRLSANQFVATTATNPAKIFGLYPRKGTIQLGADGDLVVWDPNAEGTLSVETQKMNVDYNPFEGWAYKGKAQITTVRGQVAFEDGEFVGEIGRGKFLRREPRFDW
jgi:dihydropyrimidinase